MMGKVMISGVAPQMKAPAKSFSATSWSDIITACQTNTVPDTWLVGDQKIMKIGGMDLAVDIIGKNHDTYSAGGTAPLTFQLHDCYYNASMNTSNTNVGGWTNSSMRTVLFSQLIGVMPSEIQSEIKEVSKKTSAGNQSSTIETTSDKLFLLSEVEVFGVATYSYSGEGIQYDYYKAGNSRVKNVNGTASIWWSRSPYKGNTTAFCYVDENGSKSYSMTDDPRGVSFAFCF